MPATATQKNDFFQCLCTNGAKEGLRCGLGARPSASLGLMFFGTAIRPARLALPSTPLCLGRPARLSLAGLKRCCLPRLPGPLLRTDLSILPTLPTLGPRFFGVRLLVVSFIFGAVFSVIFGLLKDLA